MTNLLIGRKVKVKLLVGSRHLGQSTAACLTAMTKGDLSTVTIDHWRIALTTGLSVAIIAVVLTLIPKVSLHISRWGVAAVAFVGTFAADVVIHGSHYNLFWGDEALFTATGAALLSLLISFTPIDAWSKKLEKSA
jgi:hypothetical protein